MKPMLPLFDLLGPLLETLLKKCINLLTGCYTNLCFLSREECIFFFHDWRLIRGREKGDRLLFLKRRGLLLLLDSSYRKSSLSPFFIFSFSVVVAPSEFLPYPGYSSDLCKNWRQTSDILPAGSESGSPPYEHPVLHPFS